VIGCCSRWFYTYTMPAKDERLAPPPEPYPYQLSARYTREQALAAIPSHAARTELCAGRFVIWDAGVLGFLDSSELGFETPEFIDWRPTEDFRVSEERPTCLPVQPRDGSARARRGVALFIRRSQEPYVYAGRAELSNWPIGATRAQWARFAVEGPVLFDPGPELASALEAELERLAPSLEEARIDPVVLRRVAKGDRDSWSEILEVLFDQGTNFPEVRIIAPFLLKALSDPHCPLADEFLWVLGSAREDPTGGAKLAAAAGLKVYLGFLAHPQPEIRRAAVFALLNCDRALVVEAGATACARMPDLAAKTCLDALGSLPAELRMLAFSRIRGALQR